MKTYIVIYQTAQGNIRFLCNETIHPLNIPLLFGSYEIAEDYAGQLLLGLKFIIQSVEFGTVSKNAVISKPSPHRNYEQLSRAEYALTALMSVSETLNRHKHLKDLEPTCSHVKVRLNDLKNKIARIKAEILTEETKPQDA